MTGPQHPQYPQQPYGGRPGYPPPPKKSNTTWIVLAVVAVVLLCGIGGCIAVLGKAGEEVSKSLDAAASSINSAAPTAPETPGAPIPPLTPGSSTGKGKNITYEIISDAADLNSVTYFDGNSELQQEISATAPWTKSVTNDSTVAIIGLGAQTNGSSVTCRIIVDGKVADEQTSTGKYAVVNCTASAF
ncbi:MmpS family transport accessory protein [Nocardia caishijiensis]|uniref:Flagellar basal body-associated protein FliL n=1 Tax=Nocardia caishijiensis TaxID=184756 RepID=A0ABQ6YG50_9NOCA|nr:MmpS family transport accessory protein [Nocardia caishijiensis]KAF0844777.1 flagellar basal body-associated protein FliL [Nocardia caishijiensis]